MSGHRDTALSLLQQHLSLVATPFPSQLSLDWSYSKKYARDLEDYELDRSRERVKNIHKLRVNKYKRKNLLAFNWGQSEEEMQEARRETRKLQRQRSVTRLL